ncbi:MAG: GIY-YIG nuclease family protein [Lachnospiraceae bacterium]
MNYTYIVECADGTWYTGWTNNLDKRIKTHNAGKGGKYTRSRLPVHLIYFEEYEDEHTARSRECVIKGLSRTQKEALVFHNNN